uniref:Collagen, type XII, alpha 1a n=1 Tax=Cyprinus carpio TaxID=7962 RepID=A0A8C1SW65_CYPCA
MQHVVFEQGQTGGTFLSFPFIQVSGETARWDTDKDISYRNEFYFNIKCKKKMSVSKMPNKQFCHVCMIVMCKTTAQADIVLLVDGSWSIGRLNFKTIRSFIGRMVGAFDIGPDRVQIGLAQYSGDPKTEWHLNTHRTRKELLDAVASLPYKGGNTLTGLALNYILQNNFKPNVGMRPNSRKIGVLVTDGKSQDDITVNSQNLRDQGIELYAIGVKNADENELRTIASDPDDIHMYNVADFSFLLDIVDDLTNNLCNSVKGPGITEVTLPPTDLTTSEVTHYSFRATWVGPDDPVEKYRIEYVSTAGGEPQKLLVDGTVTTVVLERLTPLTEYIVKVHSVVGEDSSDPLKGSETTCKYAFTHNPLHTRTARMRVKGTVTDVQLKKLRPNTAYSVSVFSLFGDYGCLPLMPIPPSGELRITDITHSTMQLDWDDAPGAVRKYIITFKPDGGEAKELEVDGDVTSRGLDNLISQTEYDVAVTPVYDSGPGNPMLNQAITDVVPAPKNLRFSEVTQTSFRAHWEHGAPDVSLYRVSWTKSGENNFQSVRHQRLNLSPDLSVCKLHKLGLCQHVEQSFMCVPIVPLGSVRNLQVTDPTVSTLNVRWEPAEGSVRQYRIYYQTVTGGAEDMIQVPGSSTSTVLKNLQSDTEYTVTVVPVYAPGEGKRMSENGKTLGLLEPRNLRVSDEWYTRFRVSWDPVPASVPRVVPGTDNTMEVFVGDVTTHILHNLQPGTTYDLKVFAQYDAGVSGALVGQGTTLYLNVTDLNTYNIGYDSFCIRWTPHRAATSYRLKLNPFNRNQYCFDGLTPDALYNATVYTQTPNQEGPGVSVKERTYLKGVIWCINIHALLVSLCFVMPVCKGAKADLVFLIDGSWSIGDESFIKVRQFVFSMIGAFDVISRDGMQVSFVQYSDEAKTEFKLNTYHDKGMVLSALQMVKYRGGNTKTGVALKHIGEKVFTSDSGMRRNVPKVLVVVTDGRSQDEVKKNAAKLQHAGYSVFVVGVADVDTAELRNIGSKPSERHVFIVDDFDAFTKIQDNLITFICETATSTCPLIYLDGFTSPGFRMLEAFNITDKTFAGMNGVSMEPGSFNSYIAYRLHKDAFISQPTKEIHPDGLSPSYTLILLFRLLPDTGKDAFDIWQISNKNNNPEVGLTIDPSSRSISFYNKDTRGEIQRVSFDNDQVKKVFHGSFHKLHISVSPKNVKLNIDCQEVAEKEIKEAKNISTDGYEVLGKMATSGGSRKQSATFQLQMFDIVCSLGWTSRDKCCDIPAMVSRDSIPSFHGDCPFPRCIFREFLCSNMSLSCSKALKVLSVQGSSSSNDITHQHMFRILLVTSKLTHNIMSDYGLCIILCLYR